MSEVEICNLSYEGKYEELKAKIKEDPQLCVKQDKTQRMPLHWACSTGHSDIAIYLIEDCKVSINAQDNALWSPLMIAASAGRDDICTALLSHGANVRLPNETGQIALHYAASRNRQGIAELLIRYGTQVNIQDKTTGATPLHRAASRGHYKIVKLLLDNGACVDVQDNQGNTSLHLACEEERIEEIELLLARGAQIGMPNKEKKTPLDLAPSHLKRRIEELAC